MDYTNKALGLRVQTQIPLNVKEYKESEESLKDLGLNNNLAFTYEKGLIVYCVQEGTRWEWREVEIGEENTGLLDLDFTYPDNIITFNIDYSNKVYNFFSTIIPDQVLPPLEKINEGNGDGIIIRGRIASNYGNIGLNAVDLSYSQINSDSLGATGQFAFTANRHTTASGHSAASLGVENISSGQYSFTTGNFCQATADGAVAMGGGNIASRAFAVALGTGATASGLNAISIGNTNFARSYGEISVGLYGTDYTPAGVIGWSGLDRIFNIGNGLNSSTKNDAFTILKNGLATLPSATNSLITAASGKAVVTKEYLESLDNLQKVITYPTDFTGTNYTLTNADNNYEIIIDNGATAVNIIVPAGLTAKIGVGFTQKGTGDVSYTTSGTTINTPVGLKIKGQFYQTYLSQELNTNTYYLGGNTKV